MSATNLKSYCKAFKVKQPKEPFFPMSGELRAIRIEVLEDLHKYIDNSGGSIIITLPMYSSLDWARDFRDCRLYLENGQYVFHP